MFAQAGFENQTTFTDCFEPLALNIGAAIVSSQIAKHLLALEDRCRSDLTWTGSIRGDVGPIPTFWQTHFRCARRKSLGLRPQKRETLQADMLRGFAIGACYSRSHFASSRAQ